MPKWATILGGMLNGLRGCGLVLICVFLIPSF